MQRGTMTEDGYLFLETKSGEWTDGDLTYRQRPGREIIADVDARTDLADRVARIRESISDES